MSFFFLLFLIVYEFSSALHFFLSFSLLVFFCFQMRDNDSIAKNCNTHGRKRWFLFKIFWKNLTAPTANAGAVLCFCKVCGNIILQITLFFLRFVSITFLPPHFVVGVGVCCLCWCVHVCVCVCKISVNIYAMVTRVRFPFNYVFTTFFLLLLI